MTRVRAGIVVAASLCALMAAGCGGGSTPTATTQRTLPGGRLGGTPSVTFAVARDVTVRVGEASRIPLTVANQSHRVHTLRLTGRGSGIDAELSPPQVTLRPLETAAVTLTLVAHRPTDGTRVDIVASLLGNALQAWQRSITVAARAS